VTVQQLCNKALQDIGVISGGGTPASAESSDAFDALNDLVASLSAGIAVIPFLTRDTWTPSGTQTYTMGPSQTINTVRPLVIRSAGVAAASTQSKPIEIVTAEQWLQIRDKGRTGHFIRKLFPDMGYPFVTLYTWPKVTGGLLEIWSYKALTAFASLAATVDLPPGYQEALIKRLAVRLAPQFGATVGKDLQTAAEEALASITKLNVGTLGPPTPAGPAVAAPEAKAA